MEVMVSFTPRPLYPQGKSPWYLLDRRLMPHKTIKDCESSRVSSVSCIIIFHHLVESY
jgi:hypothetical protein